MLLDALLARRLVILSGKGGVGKSIVGAALALAASRRGRKVLLAEVESPLEASRFFGHPPVGPVETEIHPDLWAVNFDSSVVMEEFIRERVPLAMFQNRILESPVYQRFFATAPGLAELMVLGKVMVLEAERGRRGPKYDLIVLDAPATGHGLAFLNVPRAASSTCCATTTARRWRWSRSRRRWRSWRGSSSIATRASRSASTWRGWS